MEKIAIILVNYKNYAEEFLKECAYSLKKQNYPKKFFNIYIIDNCGNEKSKKYLQRTCPKAKIIQRYDGNYTAANNIGIKKAQEDGCKYFVIANMDVKFSHNWLFELFKAIKSNNEIGIAQSKILLYPKHNQKYLKINSLGNIINYLGFGFTSHYGENDKTINGLPEIKGYASGCSFIIKKEVLDKINTYDEEYYMYHDDMEISWKAKLAGYRIVLAPKSVVYHKYKFSRSIKMLYYMERNRYITIFSFYKLKTLLLVLPALIIMDIGILFYSVVNNWFKTKIKVYCYFLHLSSWKKIIIKRNEIKKIRKKKDKEIIKDFTGKVLFQEINNPILVYIANPIFDIYFKIIKNIIIW